MELISILFIILGAVGLLILTIVGAFIKLGLLPALFITCILLFLVGLLLNELFG